MTEKPTSRSHGISRQLNCVGSKYCTTTCTSTHTRHARHSTGTKPNPYSPTWLIS